MILLEIIHLSVHMQSKWLWYAEKLGGQQAPLSHDKPTESEHNNFRKKRHNDYNVK